MIDLQPFCATAAEDNARKYLHAPFSHEGFTYASDGVLMVRVPMVEGWPAAADLKPKLGEQVLGIFKDFADAAFIAAPTASVPAEVETSTEVECSACDGQGHEHDCPECLCSCEVCNGSGKEKVIAKVSVGFYGNAYRLKYIRQMLALPRVEIAPVADASKSKPLLFRFNGGEGVLLPRREPCKRHVEMTVAA